MNSTIDVTTGEDYTSSYTYGKVPSTLWVSYC